MEALLLAVALVANFTSSLGGSGSEESRLCVARAEEDLVLAIRDFADAFDRRVTGMVPLIFDVESVILDCVEPRQFASNNVHNGNEFITAALEPTKGHRTHATSFSSE